VRAITPHRSPIHDLSEQGYAGDLATLGGGQTNNCSSGRTAEHACLLDNQLGNSSCREGAWCQKGQYKYTVNSTCAAPNFGAQQGTENACAEYVIAATPLNSSTGLHNYCSVSDAVIRSAFGRTPIEATDSRRMPGVGTALIHNEIASTQRVAA